MGVVPLLFQRFYSREIDVTNSHGRTYSFDSLFVSINKRARHLYCPTWRFSHTAWFSHRHVRTAEGSAPPNSYERGFREVITILLGTFSQDMSCREDERMQSPRIARLVGGGAPQSLHAVGSLSLFRPMSAVTRKKADN